MKFIIRMDDVCPGMHFEKWNEIGRILDQYNIKPLVAVIPDDKYFSTKEYTDAFWNMVREWRDKGWEIGLHGLTHLVKKLKPEEQSYIFFAEKSEFVGLNAEHQGSLLSKAYSLFTEQGINPKIFIAPNHGFNNDTIRALEEQTPIRVISDGIAMRPYKDHNMVFIPQLDWKLKGNYSGIRTICLHPSTMSEKEIADFERAVHVNHRHAITVDSVLQMHIQEKKASDMLFDFFFRLYLQTKIFIYKRIKGTNNSR